MAELKHRQQQEMEGKLQSPSHLPLMAQVLAPYWHQLHVCIFENSQLEGLYVEDSLYNIGKGQKGFPYCIRKIYFSHHDSCGVQSLACSESRNLILFFSSALG